MPRMGGLSDLSALHRVASLAREYDVDIIHGHGAKGGTYARLGAALGGRKAVYTPHGGSLHYTGNSTAALTFLTLEKLMNRPTGAILFESEYSARTFAEKIGAPKALTRVVHNGLAPGEFAPLPTARNASDLLYIGEMRDLKGVAILLEALKDLNGETPVTATLVGSGPDLERYKSIVETSGLSRQVRFLDPLPARTAFPLARVVVIPSLAESFPYIVLEAIAAGRPVITTKVGGIPEIFGPLSQRLVVPGDRAALAAAIHTRLSTPEETASEAADLRAHVKAHFSTGKMVSAIAATYDGLLKSAAQTIDGQEIGGMTS